jgi:hypothetical protein
MEKLIIFPYSFFFKQFDYIEIVAKSFCIGDLRCFEVELFLIENAIATIKQVI